MKINPAIATVLVFLVFSLSTKAQNPMDSIGISLAQLQERAMNTNPMLRADSLNIYKNRKLQGTAFNPSNTSFFYSEEEVPGNGADRSNLGTGINSYGLGQSFDFPTTYIQRSQLLKQRTLVAEKSYRLQQNELERQVATAYYKWVNGWQKVEFYNQLDSLYANFEKAAKLRFETGETSKLEQLNASSKRKQIELKLMESRVLYSSAILELEQLTASEISDENYPLKIQHTPILSSGNDDELMEDNAFLSYRNELVNLAEEETDVQQSQWLPDINLQYSLQTVDGTSGFYGFQAGISVPLLFNSQKANVQALKIDRMRQEELLESEMLTMNKRVSTATANYEQWLQQVAYYVETGLPMSEELLNGASLSFRVGGIDYIEYIQSLSEATNIKTNWFDALLNYNLSVIDLEYLTAKN